MPCPSGAQCPSATWIASTQEVPSGLVAFVENLHPHANPLRLPVVEVHSIIM